NRRRKSRRASGLGCRRVCCSSFRGSHCAIQGGERYGLACWDNEQCKGRRKRRCRTNSSDLRVVNPCVGRAERLSAERRFGGGGDRISISAPLIPKRTWPGGGHREVEPGALLGDVTQRLDSNQWRGLHDLIQRERKALRQGSTAKVTGVDGMGAGRQPG